jgi:hypothetical protein
MKRVEIPLRGRGAKVIVTENDIPYDNDMGYTEVALVDRRGRQLQRMVLTPEAEDALKSALTVIELQDIKVQHVHH